MKIEMIPIDDLEPYENNPRHNDEAVDYVANSIKEFGFRQPLVIDKDNVIVAGHTRAKAAMQLKLDKVPCIRADDLTDEQIRAYRIADNSTNTSTWDNDLLEFEIGELPEFDFGDFGLDFEITPPETAELETVELKPYTKAHYLLSFDVNIHDEILPMIQSIIEHGGVEVESTLN